ncbi:3'-5' exonuclease [Candidatus Nitrotoga sp. 1052]|uniref:3'-5' exonuclease n=1 Tax=Candidatus Nitrotoga sp. 1052 TaxID=2886964 RepID=UPI001EF4CAA5|nr:3'-5' exonuclease [Candidatus Nitrotoga sp. 1052]CAH1092559.1 DNA helicase [Candidatus Nitrotoga sp. 1052]
MEFLIADTFTDSLAKLTGDEQKSAKTTAFDLQINPANPGMSFHKLDKARDKNFWSVRVSSDIRLIVHKTDASLLLCYVDHHNKAYDWAERRKLETHPKTGAAQLVEIRETVQEIVVPVYVQTEIVLAPKHAPALTHLFAGRADDELLGYGVPAEWLDDVKNATEDTLMALCDHLPAEAAEALLELATGGKPRVSQPIVATANPFDHPDAQRRFRVMTNVEELQRALDFPWEKWTVFLHPEQRQWVERDYSGPARVSGSAGTGKTIVALHRAAYLARTHPDARVLLTTFSDTLASALNTKLKRLLGNEPRLAERIDVHSLDAIGLRLYKAHIGQATIASREIVRELLKESASVVGGHKFGLHFLLTEWEQVVDAWQLENWDAYRDVARLGRKTRLPEAQRVVLWSIFERVRAGLLERKLLTHAQLFTTLAAALSTNKNIVFDFAVVDEAQDISVSHLRFFAVLGGGRPNALFFAGDLGQRIFQQPFSWKGIGVDIRGRSRTLRVNYRTSHQIRTQADRLLGQVVTDVDGNTEDRSETVSVFNGPPPVIHTFKDDGEEIKAVGNWIMEQAKAGVLPHEFGVFVRSVVQLERAQAAVKAAGLSFKILDEHVETLSGHVSISTMHLAKGLEFRAVVVMACDDEVIPLQERIETVGDNADLQEVYDTERHLLYVACTRARDHLLVTSVEPASEFLDDMRSN